MAAMARGFRPIDQDLAWPDPEGRIGDILQVDFGCRTSWRLLVEYTGHGGSVWLCFDRPVSYRVHDEREMTAYWLRRSQEGATISRAYEIEASAYLDEMRDGVSASSGQRLRHILIGGHDTCVEVIATDLPAVSLARPSGAIARSPHTTMDPRSGGPEA